MARTSGGTGGGGSASISVAELAGELAVGSTLLVLSPTTVIPVDAVGLTYGSFETDESAGPFTVLPTGVVCRFEGWQVTGVDTRVDAYNISTYIVVFNAALTEVITVSGGVNANNSILEDQAMVTAADMTATATAGTDLAYDSTTGIVSSTAGGVFVVVFTGEGEWN